MFRIFATTVVASLVFALGSIQADTHKHHDGAKALGANPKEGKHSIHKSGNGHEAFAHVNKGGKVHMLSVNHATKTEKTKKVKSSKKLHAQANRIDVFVAGADAPETTDCNNNAIIFVGWAFFNSFTNTWMVFWFPINVVDNADDAQDMSGCDLI